MSSCTMGQQRDCHASEYSAAPSSLSLKVSMCEWINEHLSKTHILLVLRSSAIFASAEKVDEQKGELWMTDLLQLKQRPVDDVLRFKVFFSEPWWRLASLACRTVFPDSNGVLRNQERCHTTVTQCINKWINNVCYLQFFICGDSKGYPEINSNKIKEEKNNWSVFCIQLFWIISQIIKLGNKKIFKFYYDNCLDHGLLWGDELVLHG